MSAKKKSKKKPVLKTKKVKVKKLAEKTLESYTKEQLIWKIDELREIVRELEKEKEAFTNTVEAAKAHYFRESIFSKKFSTEVLQDTVNLFSVPAMGILF